ncbi:MAG: hypothetical protein Unbinned80contig1000_39 [Prokaryotic dsDNA virus sp.]|nr:MAG: hypothetical protein Unbinned80contig1000_39 [Prokaryotic dsDNA virus sp.]
MLNINFIGKARQSEVLDAARNGGTGKRERKAASLRLPPDLWNEVKRASNLLSAMFPDKYVTTNSTIEFLLSESLEAFWEDRSPTPCLVEEE